MGRAFLEYWISEQIDASLKEGWLPHAAGAQLGKVAVGDRLWICGRQGGSSELFIIGYLDVDRKLDKKGAQAAMRRLVPGYKVWNSSYHVLADPADACETRLLSLQPIYKNLRFDSKRSPKLVLDSDGHPNAQQLQAIRRLTAASAVMLSKYWSSLKEVASPEPISSDEGSLLEELDELDRVTSTLARLEQPVTRKLVVGDHETVACAFCGRALPPSLIVAAHIKPRAQCSAAEKREITTNVIPLCKLGCDELYERGFLEVRDGRIEEGPARPITSPLRQVIGALAGKAVLGWTPDREPYAAWRRAWRAKWWLEQK